MNTRSNLFAIAALTLGACGSQATDAPAASAPAAAATAQAAPAAPAAPAGPRVEQESFVLEAKASEAGYDTGRAGTVGVELRPRNGWHVNQDFPVQIEVRAPAELGMTKTEFARADAAAFDEEHFRFDLPVQPSAAGTRALEATVRFAICTDENCLPQENTLSLALDVR